MKIVGYVFEGNEIVITDGRQDTHRVRTPEQLWRALATIFADKALPEAEISQVPDAQVLAETFDQIQDQIDHEVGLRYGPLAGRFAGTMAKDLAKTGHRLVRNLTKKGRRGG